MKHYNAKPSKYNNLGDDVKGAQRHNFDTFENPEKIAEKAKAKKIKNNTKELKEQAIESINSDNYMDVIKTYEFQRAIESMEYEGPQEHSKLNMDLLREYVLSFRGSNSKRYNFLGGKYNRLNNLIWRLRYKVRENNWNEYFEKKSKASFIEKNGIKTSWILSRKFKSQSIGYLQKSVKAVQFGNSLPELEREYCMDNLSNSIKVLSKYFDFEFNSIAFSYGARGNAGSIAHYQDSQKVLAFNRGWDGALVHELGHAIDYSLGLPSRDLLRSIKSKYRAQLHDKNVPNMHYYMKNVEIFARLFEQYCRKCIPELTSFMQSTFCTDVMPELDNEAMDFMNEALKGVLK